jgi:hypothetical protein
MQEKGGGVRGKSPSAPNIAPAQRRRQIHRSAGRRVAAKSELHPTEKTHDPIKPPTRGCFVVRSIIFSPEFFEPIQATLRSLFTNPTYARRLSIHQGARLPHRRRNPPRPPDRLCPARRQIRIRAAPGTLSKPTTDKSPFRLRLLPACRPILLHPFRVSLILCDRSFRPAFLFRHRTGYSRRVFRRPSPAPHGSLQGVNSFVEPVAFSDEQCNDLIGWHKTPILSFS